MRLREECWTSGLLPPASVCDRLISQIGPPTTNIVVPQNPKEIGSIQPQIESGNGSTF